MKWELSHTRPVWIAALIAWLITSLIFSPVTCSAQDGQSSVEASRDVQINLTGDDDSDAPLDGGNESRLEEPDDIDHSSNTRLIAQSVAEDDGTRTLDERSLPEHKAHVYVSNSDDDGLDVSLFIDSELKDTRKVSSGSDEEFGIYPLREGRHSFKISWWDEDVKRSIQSEEAQEIENETSVILYTFQNRAPEKYDLSVDLANENQKDLKAYLFIDGSFEKSSSVSEGSTSNLGEFELEEGIHELSVMWQDPDTYIEYEKMKRVYIGCNDIVIFRAPEGVSFEAGFEGDLDLTEDSRSDQGARPVPQEVKSEALDLQSIEAKEESGATAAYNGSAISEEISDGPASEESYEKPQDARMASSEPIESSVSDDGRLYSYLAVVIFALYLLFIRR